MKKNLMVIKAKSIWPLWSNEGILATEIQNPFGHFGPTREGTLDFCITEIQNSIGHFGPMLEIWKSAFVCTSENHGFA